MKRRLIPPVSEPVSLGAVKDQLRIELEYIREDAHLQTLIGAARAYVENHCDRALVTQTWDIFFQEWDDFDSFVFPLGQLQSVSSIVYIDEDGVSLTLPVESYRVEGIGTDEGRVVLTADILPFVNDEQTWVIQVTFVCGLEPENIPEDLRLALLFFISHHWQHRNGAIMFEKTMEALLANYRLQGVF